MSRCSSPLQFGYAFIRCALAHTSYSFGDNHKAAEVAQRILFGCDVLDTAYLGKQVHDELKQNNNRSSVQFYTDLAVKATFLIGVATVFVIATNRLLRPKVDLVSLLEKAQIPQEVFTVIPGTSLSHLSVVWVKPLLQMGTAGLSCTRILLNLYLAYLKSTPVPLLQAAVYAMTALKAVQYRTLEIKHCFDSLFRQINYSVSVSEKYPEFTKYFTLPIKKVEATFYLDAERLSEPLLIEKITTVYKYSLEMFQNSGWSRWWPLSSEYFDAVVESPTREVSIFSLPPDFANAALIYKIFLRGNIPPAPVQVKVFHQDTVWSPFKAVDAFRWLPRFWIPKEKIAYSKWIACQLELPLSRMDSFFTGVGSVLERLLKQAAAS